MGYKGVAGSYLLAWTTGGSYYFGVLRFFFFWKDMLVLCPRLIFVDNGASQLIIDGKINLKNDSLIKSSQRLVCYSRMVANCKRTWSSSVLGLFLCAFVQSLM